MTPLENYYQRILDSKCPSAVRKQIVDFYNTTRNISLVSRVFKTTRKTVRKIVRRFQQEGEDGLKNRSRRPHRIPNAISPQIEARIVALREFSRIISDGKKITVRLGQERIKWFLAQQGINISVSTINRVLRKHNLIKPRLKK
ncbi:MAG: helix-turn-helix domain-containing protein [bacterium]